MHLSMLLPFLILYIAFIEVETKKLNFIGGYTCRVIICIRLLKTGCFKHCLKDKAYCINYQRNLRQPERQAQFDQIINRNNCRDYFMLQYYLTMCSLWLAYAIVAIISSIICWSNISYLVIQIYLGCFFAWRCWQDAKETMQEFFDLFDDIDATTKNTLDLIDSQFSKK